MSADQEAVNGLAELRDWLKGQPHVPEIDEPMLRRFLHSCYYDIDSTKRCIERFYSMRSSNPKIFNKRDPLSPELKKVFTYARSVFLTNGKDNIRLWQLNDPDMKNYDHPETTKAFMMMTDVTFIDEKHLPARDIFVLDSNHVSLKFLTKVNLSVMKNSATYLQEALPVRLKQLHVVNAPSYIDKLYAIIKPFLGQNLIAMIHFHKPNSETIFDHVDRELLPKDYGGSAPSVDELMRDWVKRLESHREFFVDETLWRADDSKRPRDSKLARTNASFKSLAID